MFGCGVFSCTSAVCDGFWLALKETEETEDTEETEETDEPTAESDEPTAESDEPTAESNEAGVGVSGQVEMVK